MLRSILLLLSGNAATSLITLSRNLLIARLIPVADYGIAATFAIAMAVVEMVSALGMEQQIVQSKRGGDPDFQSAIQGFNLVRGLMSFCVLFASAGLMADFLNVPDLAWAYQVMALVPLLRSAAHFDTNRFKRDMRFGPALKTSMYSALAAVLVIWPAYQIFPDYRVMLVSLLVQGVAFTIVSHLLAERPYRARLDFQTYRESMDFGWPLLLNGILLFAVMHGEKLIAGRVIGLESLGLLAMGVTLTMTPTLVLGKSLQDLFLPQLSAVQDDDAAFQRMSESMIECSLAGSLLYCLAMTAFGSLIVIVLLGDKYAGLVPLMAWLAIQQTLRIFKTGGSSIAVARGQTSNPMIANAIRVLSLPVAWWVATSGGGLIGLIQVAIAGEAAGFVVSLMMVRWRLKIRLGRVRVSLMLSLATILVAGWVAASDGPNIAELAFLTATVLAALVAMRSSIFQLVAWRKI